MITEKQMEEVEKFMSSISETVKRQRHERGMTQKDLAKKAGVSEAIVSLVEREKISNMTVATMVKIMRALDGWFEIEHKKEGEETEIIIPIKL